MTSKLQQRISKICLGAASAALTLLVVLGFGVVTTPLAQARTYKVLHKFTGGSDGGQPYAGVIRDAQGNLYGTTFFGGAYGDGVVFKVGTSGRETVLYSFTGGADGALPYAGVIRDAQGDLYGTANEGGNSPCGCGVVFKLGTTGQETVLYSFTHGADGANPAAGLIRAQGNLYGTTFWGGVYDYGTVFELSPTGQETVLYGFTGGNDGGNSGAGLIRDAQGNLYGTAESGGDMSSCDSLGCGVVFKLSSTGQETVLHSFTGGADGAIPYAGLIRDAQGNLYGTTGYGGDMSSCSGNGCGVVFKLSSTGKETVLYRFKGGADGAGPTAGVIRDAQGNLHGTTWGGGAYGKGTVFELSPTGKETVLHSFAGADGANPEAGVIEDTNGNLYGTTSFGSAYSNGVVFELKP